MKAKNENEYEVNVIFDDDIENAVIFNGQTLENETIGQTFLLNSFLSYKEILRTHFLQQYEFNERFFELLTETLLVEHEVGGTTIGNALKDLQDRLSEPTDKADLLRKIRETNPDADEEDLDEVDRDAELTKFKIIFDEKLEALSVPLNDILRFFKQAITVKFEGLQLSFDDNQKKVKGNLGLDVTYIEIEHINHLEVLNEARLAALALSIYLAAIATNPVSQKAKYKILFLDDIFIGLDMSNRLPLLKVLQEFSLDGGAPFFEDFQIFLTTYDRYWFEIAGRKLGASWTAMEMYAGKKEDQDFEYPIIVSPSESYYQRAQKYTNRKKDGNERDIDYPAAANYLRKEVESVLKSLLWGKYRYKNGDDGQTLIREGLQELWDSFALMIGDLGFAPDPFPEFGTLSKAVLNPFSHDNLAKPIYRSEIDEAFEFVDKLRSFKRIELLKQNDEIFVSATETKGDVRSYCIKVRDSILVYEFEAVKRTNVLTAALESRKYTVEGKNKGFTKQEGCLSKLFDMAHHDASKEKNASNGKEMLDEFVNGDGKSLRQLIEGT